MTTIFNTKLLYLENMQALTCDAQVTNIIHNDNNTIIELDQTVFYPQGGGQPYDTGIITNASARFIVQEVRFINGVVKHIGLFAQGTFSIGETVSCTVDKERRLYHCRLHSAGHVIDMAITQLNLDWIPGKGFHFPEGPYVEYSGTLDTLDKEKLQQDIEHICKNIIAANFVTSTVFVPKQNMAQLCRNVPGNLPENKPSRVVLYGDFGVPCGGTHVQQTGDIVDMTIRKVKLEKGAIRVSYAVTPNIT